MKDITKYSNPARVKQLANQLLDNSVELSTRKDKKYMIKDPETDKYIHFGQIPYQDFTKSKDLEARNRFRIRNSKWRNAPIYTPRWLSYHLLW